MNSAFVRIVCNSIRGVPGVRLIRYTLPMVLISGSSGCVGIDEDFTCPAMIVPSLEIVVVDAALQTPIAVVPRIEVRDARGSIVLIERTGAAANPEQREYSAYGGAGTFNVSVGASGYRDFARNNVSVALEGACKFPQTVKVRAELVKS